MRKYFIFRKRIILLSALLLISACAYSAAIIYPQTAIQFRAALNTNDIGALVKLTKLPLTVFEQEWESAQDGSGFVLGQQKISRIEKAEDLKKFLHIFAPRVMIDGEHIISIPLSEYQNFKAELAGSMEQWRGLEIFLFKRGEGDVEHIVLLGIDPKSNKINAIYLN